LKNNAFAEPRNYFVENSSNLARRDEIIWAARQNKFAPAKPLEFASAHHLNALEADIAGEHPDRAGPPQPNDFMADVIAAVGQKVLELVERWGNLTYIMTPVRNTSGELSSHRNGIVGFGHLTALSGPFRGASRLG
jgi:hypothetical protein